MAMRQSRSVSLIFVQTNSFVLSSLARAFKESIRCILKTMSEAFLASEMANFLASGLLVVGQNVKQQPVD